MEYKKNLLEKMINGRIKAKSKAERMKDLGKKVKLDIQNLNNVQYKNIGDYELPINPSPAFSYMSSVVNFTFEGENRLRELQIKGQYKQLNKNEGKELLLLLRAREKREISEQAEQARTERAVINQTGGLLKSLL